MTSTLYQRFADLEQHFFANLSVTQMKNLTCNGSLQIRDSYLYGEFAFLISGLKPCLLVCFPDTSMNTIFQNTVLDNVLQNQSRFQVYMMDRNVVSDEMDLNGCLFVVDQENTLAPVVMALLEDKECCSVSEQTLAQILDYPGSLPSNAGELETMVEVAYCDVAKSSDSPTIVTTFAAQHGEVEKVKQHFEKCKQSVSNFGIDLKLSIRNPEI
ncbi:hypothetical protein K450DRAFT_244063 [Umbelopsis ramanniana AG]|uniref:Uncharacterized protein n=1 Tax=Umbelopsis ramanniana AG TaxID=1314678 RepID=A0AAD5HCJ2_UMBRA|nr:uncharacterized protein K450DRAFT_244063 [Umbelopsis ramanniana AG]KAI8579137.1 hypothetical protein K450DRAFT_244063 [Umbelopsis ramanniana AG]